MRITINGEARDVRDGVRLADLIGELGLDPRRLAVERNRQLVPRRQFDQTPLAEGDTLEIVTLVGGG